jgi:hypothetical protein
MEKTHRPIPWFSGGLATLVAFFVVAVALPNVPRLVVDFTVNPPHRYFRTDPSEVCFILVTAFAPVLCIFILGRRWIIFDWLGWFVLAFAFLAVLSR